MLLTAVYLRCDQVFLKGRAKRHPDVADGRGKKSKAVADFRMEGNRNVTYGKFEHVVSLLLMCRHVKALCHQELVSVCAMLFI